MLQEIRNVLKCVELLMHNTAITGRTVLWPIRCMASLCLIKKLLKEHPRPIG